MNERLQHNHGRLAKERPTLELTAMLAMSLMLNALQDIHCTGDAVKRMKYWGKDSAGEHMLWDGNDRAWKYVIPVHLAVEQLAQATNELIDLRTHMTMPSAPLLQREGN